MRSLIISICVLSLLFHSCKNENSKALQLGEVELAVSGSEEAIPHFERGLLLLHSFEYFDARAAFLKAQELWSYKARNSLPVETRSSLQCSRFGTLASIDPLIPRHSSGQEPGPSKVKTNK